VAARMRGSEKGWCAVMAKKKSKDDDADGDVVAPDAGAKKKKLIMMAGGGALALLLMGGGGYWFMSKGKKDQAQVAAADGKPGDARSAPAGGPKKPSAFLDLPEMTINLAAGGSQADRQQFLRMKVSLEVAEQKVATEIQPMMPRVVDTFQIFMRELRPQDLDGSAGLYRLKEEMTRRVNVAVYPARVDAVLFKELMVQ
jgi:flagellar protein FliL